MKNKIFFSLLASFLIVKSVNGQALSNLWGNGLDNCGIGPFNIQVQNRPNFQLQIHGTTDYIVGSSGVLGSGDMGSGPVSFNAGKTSTFGMTNAVIGKLSSDGVLLRMSEKNFHLTNQENDGNITINSNAASMLFQGSTNRIYVGATQFAINDKYAKLNIFANSNEAGNNHGLNIRVSGDNTFGLTVQASSKAPAIQVFENNSKNFMVSGAGEVYGRKFTTTLNAIPDYVFEPSYKLMPITDLRTYLQTNKHLPNIPSAKEIAENNNEVDLGEMNRLLLEKVEESMLYILQLEERIKALEQK